MAKEEDLKSGVEGVCQLLRRLQEEVLKALSIKGVLRTEIHPTQPKVTVTSNVDAQILVKKLARLGKSAEILLEGTQKPQEGEKSSQTGDEKLKKPNKKGKEERDGGGSSSSDKLPEFVSKGSSSGDGDSRAREREEACGCEATRSALPTIVAAIPPGMVQDSAVMAAAYARVYYPVAGPVQHYSVDSYAAHPHHCVQEHYCLEMRANRAPPPMQSQATAFGDYFNDDNTVGAASCEPRTSSLNNRQGYQTPTVDGFVT